MNRVSDRLYSWASHIEENTLAQAEALSRLPIIAGHVALMPDAHLGIGSTVGSVIPTRGAIIPAAIGVDIGCGMIAVKTSLNSGFLPDSLHAFVEAMETVVPAGLGKWHQEPSKPAQDWYSKHKAEPSTEFTDKQINTVLVQLGTLGSGNHFLEVATDEDETVWLLIHSGSRGIGNQLANVHMKIAKTLCDYDFVSLRGLGEDKALAWLEEGTVVFDAYIADMLFSQAYALENRSIMMDNALKWFFNWLGAGRETERINCHHNFTQLETHDGEKVWLTRKGAIRAGKDDRGLIPGSMGQSSYVIQGKGNPDSYESCAHGAGRRLSRTAARKELSLDSFAEKMKGASWQSNQADKLLDEHPDAYKSIDIVMEDQKDLVEIEYRLKAIANYKGTS